MKAYICITDDDGQVVAEHDFDPAHPTQWRTQSGQRILMENYEFYGFTYQPHVRVVHPVGYKPAPQFLTNPVNGQPWGGGNPTPMPSVQPKFNPQSTYFTPQGGQQGSGLASDPDKFSRG